MDYYEMQQTGDYAPSGFNPTDAEAERDAWNAPGGGYDSYNPSPGGIPSSGRGNTTIYQGADGGYTNMPTTTDMQLYSGPDIMNGGSGPSPYSTQAMADANISLGGGGGGFSTGPGTTRGTVSNAPGYYEARENRMNAEGQAFSDRMWAQKSGPSSSISMVNPAAAYPGGAGQSSGIPNRTTVQYASPTMSMPSLVTPTFTAPEPDKAAISARIQEIMAPQASALKRAVREAVARRRFGSPVLEKYALEGALEGYGRGLGEVQGKAQPLGRNAYFQEDFKPKWDAAVTNHNTTLQAALQNWQGQMQAYLQTMQHTTDQYTNA